MWLFIFLMLVELIWPSLFNFCFENEYFNLSTISKPCDFLPFCVIHLCRTIAHFNFLRNQEVSKHMVNKRWWYLSLYGIYSLYQTDLTFHQDGHFKLHFEMSWYIWTVTTLYCTWSDATFYSLILVIFAIVHNGLVLTKL